MYTLVGGTFNHFHKGHELMLRTAIDTGCRVIIGLTSDDYVIGNKEFIIKYRTRLKRLKKFMDKYTDNYEIHELNDKFGETLKIKEANLIVSPETYSTAIYINNKRNEMNMRPLNIIKVPFVLAEDFFPISSTRIEYGEITRTGKRKNPIKISISTNNSLKTMALRDFLNKFMKNFDVIENHEYETDTDQPYGDDTPRLARLRAMKGLRDNDYSIGIESGLFYNKINNVYYDFHYCAVIDRYSRITTGVSSGFELPEDIVDVVRSGLSVSDAIKEIYNIPDIGKREGIIGLISNYNIKRYDLIMESIRNAFIVRFRPDLYNIFDFRWMK
ncbi:MULTISPECIES: pantetheine-phosphate adenylyltransferase [Acidiplasma]|jgi:pantetheine-phosphate adenylyltransferase|uniref:Phosphopantetheine adenylyltransferase n=2 Tax=Acidiplasma aeolicum TaxID=507754 RepID=A0A0N8VKK3_9ARCH|nr:MULTISPECIES: pantetheine-phosphate adenylyltransferase [Acidiplasma]KJE48898.1 phosphopantetheine adenylyltransferase [Acidiplasma sp. MBA-1]KQB33964.1 phosphopantetheine adenylyltransferase [Acidiplasma aeolicum]WMT54306.1 MAG: pantetheine-phosphate adenylyltransferase [Acidiplasma sp.]